MTEDDETSGELPDDPTLLDLYGLHADDGTGERTRKVLAAVDARSRRRVDRLRRSADERSWTRQRRS